jgi:hypothetical protein
MKSNIGAATCVLALVLTGAPAVAQTDVTYTFTRIDYPGAAVTRVIGVNDHLEMVGHYIMPGGVRHAMLLKLGTFIPLDPDGILGTHPSAATQINNRGEITGWYSDATGRHGYVLRGDALTTIDFPGSSYTQVNGVSDQGVMFGHFRDAAGVFHGFVLRGPSFEQMDAPGAVDTLPYYVNARGDTIGEWDPDPRVIGHGFLLTKDGEWVSFDAPGAAPDSSAAIGINDRGEILGFDIQPGGRVRGWIVNAANVSTDEYAFFFPPGTSGYPETMNNAGVIVGYYSDAGSVHGFVATPNERR